MLLARFSLDCRFLHQSLEKCRCIHEVFLAILSKCNAKVSAAHRSKHSGRYWYSDFDVHISLGRWRWRRRWSGSM